jgi:carboxyl-terminal processing protease
MSMLLRVGVIVTAMVLWANLLAFAADVQRDYKELKRFRLVMVVIQKNYVKDVSDKQLMEGAIEGMFKAVSASDGLKKEIEALTGDAQAKPSDASSTSHPPQLPKSQDTGKSPDYQAVLRFRRAMELIRKQHPLSDKELIDAAVKGMLASLDSFSSYLPPEDFRELKTENKGQLGGAGLEFTIRDGTLTVVAPLEGGPASKAGLKPSDKIIKIGGETTKNISLLKAVGMMRGPKGSRVTLTIEREGFKSPKDFTLTREVVYIYSVKKREIEPGYPYIKMVNFQENTDTALEHAVKELGGDQRIKGLILDLRNNPGGLLDQSVKVANMFMDKGLKVYTDGRAKDQRMEFRANPTRTSYKFKVAVLINGGSAGSSEIVSGALQDHDRGLILGQKSFGMGSVQTTIPLEDGSGLRLTTAYFYTPKGRHIQKGGLPPNVEVDGPCVPCEKGSVDKASLKADSVVMKALDWLKSDVTVKQYKMQQYEMRSKE